MSVASLLECVPQVRCIPLTSEGIERAIATFTAVWTVAVQLLCACCIPASQVNTVVDHFHFKSHKGTYCKEFTDPYKHKVLNGGANLSVCEQRFKYIAQHKKSFRY